MASNKVGKIRQVMGAGTDATLTTAAAEKIYRARDGDTDISVRLDLEAGARLAWLPQPTILFDQSRLDRRTSVTLAGTATFVAVETLIFGRMAILLVEQYFDFARSLADTYAVMERGEVVLAGKGAEMVESDVRRYLTV